MATPPTRIKGSPGLDPSSDQIISPLDIATNGVLAVIPSRNIQTPALTMATMGWIVFLEEEIEEVEIDGGGGGPPARPGDRKKKKLRKKITCRVMIAGEWYEKVAYTNDIKMNLKDVDVEINTDKEKKPIIEIILPEVKNGRNQD